MRRVSSFFIVLLVLAQLAMPAGITVLAEPDAVVPLETAPEPADNVITAEETPAPAQTAPPVATAPPAATTPPAPTAAPTDTPSPTPKPSTAMPTATPSGPAETDEPSSTTSPTATPDTGSQHPEGDYPPYNEDPERYRVEVDLTNCAVFIYERDEEGMYTVLVREMIMTSGNEENRTPAGTFRIGYMKERFGHFLAFRGDYAQYWTQVVNGVYFHSILYGSRNESTMKSASYNNLGRNVSHGCIRLYVEDARWIYYNIPGGTICHLSNRKRNPELTARLKKKVSFGNYDPGVDPNPAPEPDIAWCNANSVPLSTGFFGPKDSGLGTVDRGVQVEVLQRGKEYLKIRIVDSGKEGYTYARYFQKEEPGEIEIKDGEIGVAHLRREQIIYAQPGGEPLKNKAWKNTDYEILEITEDHFKVKLGDVEGYIPIAQMDFMTYPEDTEFMIISKSRASKLSMRAKPDEGSEVLEMLDFGDEGRVFYYGPEYSLIRCRGRFGYVQSRYITVEFQVITDDDDDVLPDDVSPSEVDESTLSGGDTEPSASPDDTQPEDGDTASPSPSPGESATPSSTLQP